MLHIVFDLDGTLTDTQEIHQRIESDFLQKKGLDLTPSVIGTKYAGRSPKERIPELLTTEKIAFTQEEIDNFVDNKDQIILSLLKTGKIKLIPNAKEILIYLHNKGHKIGLSSGSSRTILNEVIPYFNLENIITASTSANEVEHKKPYPDVFIASFKKLEEMYGKPDEIYVIGDGRSDIEGGYKAGAKTIRLNNLSKEKINNSYCYKEIKSLEEIEEIIL